MDKEDLIVIKEFIENVRDYKCHQDMKEGDMPFSVVDYYNFDRYIEIINKELKKVV